MPSADQLRTRLIGKLKELFQLDQPDLDFGFYRIMHMKSAEISAFLDKDLLQIIADTFENSAKDQAKSELELALEKITSALGEEAIAPDGSVVEKFSDLPLAKEYTALLADENSHLASLSDEAQIYDHLYRFFERYYEGGDFLSRRYHTRETANQAAPYAIPYNGEEVMLHWANKDQYYTKTAEHFSNYSFDLIEGSRKNAELTKKSRPDSDQSQLDLNKTGLPEKLPVHFRIKDATEGEHGNIKESDSSKRHFHLHPTDPFHFEENGELSIHFEYRPARDADSLSDERKEELKKFHLKKDGTPVTAAIAEGNLPPLHLAEALLTALATSDHPAAENYRHLLAEPAPTDKLNARPLLAKYIAQYTARNSMDYFIHKDLGIFLRREFDFYIKNEIIRLDDLTSETVTAPVVADYLEKIKVLRRIATKIIAFLAQLEDFQKKLWLKKKFVTDTQYCFTLDRIAEKFYAQIAASTAQREEWVKLYAIDEIEAAEGDLARENTAGYSEPLTIAFLKQNPHLVLDTAHFDAGFKAEIVSSIPDLEKSLDGNLFHSENFQALSLMQERYRETVKCVYIDPPYNTGGDGFLYRDSYQHSSWLAQIFTTLGLSKNFLTADGVCFSSIDDSEVHNLINLFEQTFGANNHAANIVWQKRYSPDIRKCISDAHEFLICYANNIQKFKDVRRKLPLTDFQTKQFSNRDNDPRGPWKSDNFTAQGYRPNQMYPVTLPSGEIVTPPPGRCWVFTEPKFKTLLADDRMYFGMDGSGRPGVKRFLSEMNGMVPWTWWEHKQYGNSQEGLKQLMEIFSRDAGIPLAEMAPKPTRLIGKVAHISLDLTETLLDYFAGSGTTGHAVINLNREDGGTRKYILVEMGDHFDTVLRPRLKKVAYSADWKNGKPVSRNTGISHAFKYQRLESYEDALNNLAFREDLEGVESGKDFPKLRESYFLHYLLEHQTGGSQSLLNIAHFADPTAYRMKLKNAHSDATEERPVDLIETFHYLLGLRVQHAAAPQTFDAEFARPIDKDLPKDMPTKLVLDGRLKANKDGEGEFWLRSITGWLPRDTSISDEESRNEKPQNMERILIIWRKLTGDLEKDNAVLEAYFTKLYGSTREQVDVPFDTIYINGSNNLPNLKTAEDRWRVELIEETFHKRMWSEG